jgi:hypothetical protein
MTVLYIFLYYIVAYIRHNGDISLERKKTSPMHVSARISSITLSMLTREINVSNKFCMEESSSTLCPAYFNVSFRGSYMKVIFVLCHLVTLVPLG